MRRLIRAAPFALTLFAVTLIALIPHRQAPSRGVPLFSGARIDEPTLQLFQRSCQNCHSENTEWPWYSRVPPASWLVAKDVNAARRHVNFSRWGAYSREEQEALLTRIGVAARTGIMPLPRYLFLHHEARLTAEERQQIYDWTRAERKRLRAEGTP